MGDEDTELVRAALLSSALTNIGRDFKDTRLVIYGVEAQTRAIGRLRHAFGRLLTKGGDPTFFRLSALLCAMSELVNNGLWPNFVKYQDGVGALIKQDGPELTTSTSADLFCGFRTMQLTCIVKREPCFLRRPGWMAPSWKHQRLLAQGEMQTILDIAYQIPRLVQIFDTEYVRTSPKRLQALLQKLQNIAKEFKIW